MPLPANQLKTLEVVIRGTIGAAGAGVTPAVTTLHYTRRTVAVNASKSAFNTAFAAGPLAALLAAANVRYTPNVVSLRFLEDANDVFQDFTVAGAGAIATDSLPSDQSIFTLFRTNLRGKSYKGGAHWALPSEIDTTGDVLTGAGLGRWQALQTALAAAIVDATPNTWDLQVVSRKLCQLRTNPTTVVTNQVTQVLLDINIGRMKTRKVRTTR